MKIQTIPTVILAQELRALNERLRRTRTQVRVLAFIADRMEAELLRRAKLAELGVSYEA